MVDSESIGHQHGHQVEVWMNSKRIGAGGMEIAEPAGGIGISTGGIDIGGRTLGVDGSGIVGQVVPSPSASKDKLRFATTAACCWLLCIMASLRSISWLVSLEV